MKIILIRQPEPEWEWKDRYDSAGFTEALADASKRGIPELNARRSDAAAYRIYTDTSRAGAETAGRLFAFTETPERTPLLDRFPLSAFRDTKRHLPLWLWRVMGYLQWTVGSEMQTESMRKTLRRIRKFADLLEAEDRDCIVLCSGFVLLMLKTILRFRGYCLEGGALLPKPLDRIRATKQSLHCGGCHHNCLLTSPKCQIGQNKAKERGVRTEV